MQEWMIAMLVISVLLILRDMAKTIFSEMKKSAATLAYEQQRKCSAMRNPSRNWQTVFTACLTGRIIFPARRLTR